MALAGTIRGMLEPMFGTSWPPEQPDRRTDAADTVEARQRDRRLEQKLISRARSGDQQAFDTIVSDHIDAVWQVVWRIVRHRQDAEDVVQEVFLTVHRSLAQFREQSRLSTWIHRIAVTRALNHLDRNAEKLRRSSDSIDEPERHELVADSTMRGTPLQQLEQRELLERLQACLGQLPPEWRAVLALRENRQLSYQRIAETLELAIGTVRSRIARARDALRICLENG